MSNDRSECHIRRQTDACVLRAYWEERQHIRKDQEKLLPNSGLGSTTSVVNGDVGECGCVFRCEKEVHDLQMLRFPSDMSTWYSQGILLWRSCGRGDCGLWGCRVANR